MIPKPGATSVVLIATALGLLVASVIAGITDGLDAVVLYAAPGACIAYAAEIAANEYHFRCALMTQLLEARLAAAKEKRPG